MPTFGKQNNAADNSKESLAQAKPIASEPLGKAKPIASEALGKAKDAKSDNLHHAGEKEKMGEAPHLGAEHKAKAGAQDVKKQHLSK